MIITAYGMIVFQLVLWFKIASIKSEKSADRKYGVDMLGFAYPAIPTRHEVPRKTLAVMQNERKPTKL